MTFNHGLIRRTISMLMFFEGIAMLPSLFCAMLNGENRAGLALGITALAGIAAGGIGRLATHDLRMKIKIRESYFVVLISWLTVIIMGIFPYLMCGKGYSLVDSIFESVAGWTTSSSWVLDINQMPKSIVLWKATTNCLGGMGVILIAILILSSLGISGQRMANAEVPGPTLEKSKPRMMDTAKLTYAVYGTMSIVELILLLIGKIPFFDALVNTMSTISTAGVMDYKGSVAMHFTPYIKCVLVIFSVMASLNFLIYIKIVQKKFSEAVADYEMRWFLGSLALSTIFIAIVLRVSGTYKSIFTAFINGLVGVVSFGCTTGFNIESIRLWPTVTKVLLVLLMIVGGCANSTSGGVKVIRAVVFFKLIKRGIYKRIHPRSVKPIMIRNTPVSAENASSISTFLLLFLAIYLFSCIVFSLENMDMETTLTAPIALFTNTGTGFGDVSKASYNMFSAGGKLYASLLMLAGRLEMYAILIMFSRSFWNSDRVK